MVVLFVLLIHVIGRDVKGSICFSRRLKNLYNRICFCSAVENEMPIFKKAINIHVKGEQAFFWPVRLNVFS